MFFVSLLQQHHDDDDDDRVCYVMFDKILKREWESGGVCGINTKEALYKRIGTHTKSGATFYAFCI